MTSSTTLLCNTRVYTLADKLGINGLKVLSKAKFAHRALDGWNSKDFSQAIHEIYDNIPLGAGIHEVALAVATSNFAILKEREDFDAVLQVQSAFTYDLLMNIAEDSHIIPKYGRIVHSCQGTFTIKKNLGLTKELCRYCFEYEY